MSTHCDFSALGGGRYALKGDVGFETVTDLLERSRDPFSREQRIELDFSGVTSSDSAALALLIEWIRMARARGIQIAFTRLPGQLLALAGISDLDDVFAELSTDPSGRADQKSSSASPSSSHSSSISSGSIGGSPS